jgi:hypothetical protein
MKKPNKKMITKRNLIIFGRPEAYDAERFNKLTLEQLNELKLMKVLDPKEQQNDSPTIKEFMDFMKDHPGVTAHGYVISEDREDCRVSLEGIAYEGSPSKKLILDFTSLCRDADEFTANEGGLYAWWD